MFSSRLIKFLVTGAFATIINYSFFYICLLLGIYYMFSSTIGFLIGLFAGYLINKKWTFGISKNNTNCYIVRYCTVYLISLLLSLVLLKFLVIQFSFIPEIANILTILFTTCTNFMGIRYWVFCDTNN